MHQWRITNPARKHLFVVDIALDPCHQMLDIFRRRHLGRSLEILRVLPQVFKPANGKHLQTTFPHTIHLLIRCLHLRARLRRAKLGDGAVEEVNLVVKVDD